MDMVDGKKDAGTEMKREYIVQIDFVGDPPETEELVRCRKCNKSCLEEGKINGFWCRKRKEWHDGDWYCADGERKR